MSDHAGDDPTPRAGEGGGYRKTPSQLATDPAFTGTYARGVFPSTVATSVPTNAYDYRRQVYNGGPNKLRRTRAKMGLARAGSGLCRIACVGDSITAGQGAAPATTSYPAHLSAILAARGYTSAGIGLVPLSHQNTANDARWAFGTGWNNFDTTTMFRNCSTNGSAATFTSDAAGTIVEVFYLGSSAAFTVNIDGAGAVAVTPPGTQTLATYQVTGLANTTHTVVITTTTSSSTYIVGCQVRGTSGVLVAGLGLGNTKSADWALSNFYNSAVLTAAWAPDLTCIMLGTNDLNTSVSVATAQANLSGIIDRFKAVGDVLLLHPIPGSGLDFSQAYSAMYYGLADSKDVPLLDLSDRWGSYSIANGLTLMNDTLHANAGGYADIAFAVLGAIAA